MIDKIEIIKELDTVDSYFQTVANSYEALEGLYSDLDSMLADSRWQGEAHNMSAEIHPMIKEYASRIKPLCEALICSSDELQSDINSFASDSTNVNALKGW